MTEKINYSEGIGNKTFPSNENTLYFQNVIKHVWDRVNDNPDSIEIGTPSKGGTIKVYGDYNKPDEFRVKIDNSIRLRNYTNDKLKGESK